MCDFSLVSATSNDVPPLPHQNHSVLLAYRRHLCLFVVWRRADVGGLAGRRPITVREVCRAGNQEPSVESEDTNESKGKLASSENSLSTPKKKTLLNPKITRSAT